MAARRPPAVARVLERVTKTAREYDMFQPGELVLVSVSGGPDSVCLLYSLWHLRRLFRIRLAVFHFDHKLRADSSKDAGYVRMLSDRLSLPYYVRVATDAPHRGQSPELWARYHREHASAVLAREIGAERQADGHTLDDQAETVLIALVRGWGLDGMSAIRPTGRIVRPLLDTPRSDVEAFCRSLHLRPRRDPTNRDLNLLRNAIRHEALPAIERATGRDVVPTFARAARLLRRDASALDAIAEGRAVEIVEFEDGRLSLRARPLVDLHPAIASRVVRRAFRSIELPWSERSIEGILDLARGRPGRTLDLGMGASARRTRTEVLIER